MTGMLTNLPHFCFLRFWVALDPATCKMYSYPLWMIKMSWRMLGSFNNMDCCALHHDGKQQILLKYAQGHAQPCQWWLSYLERPVFRESYWGGLATFGFQRFLQVRAGMGLCGVYANTDFLLLVMDKGNVYMILLVFYTNVLDTVRPKGGKIDSDGVFSERIYWGGSQFQLFCVKEYNINSAKHISQFSMIVSPYSRVFRGY